MSAILSIDAEKEVYIKWYARDFTLGMFQIWYRGEAVDRQEWASGELPYKPYIVFHRTGETGADVYYGEKGVAWVFDEVLSAAKRNPKFVQKISDEYRGRISKVQNLIETEPALSMKELERYLGHIRGAWPWFNAIWYAIDKFDGMPEYAKELEFLTGTRKETERQVPATDTIIRKSIRATYPKVSSYADVVLLEEAFEDRIPSIETLAARRQGYYFSNDRLFPDSPKEIIEELFHISIKTSEVPQAASELKGTVACRGKAIGNVRRIFGVKQVPDFKSGEILVAASTIPDFLPALKKAAAIVSDEGGAICHAAITSRELNKPCVIGTRHAMDILKDGDLVEVDANAGVVRILERASV